MRALPDLQLGSLIATLIPAHYEPDLVNVESTNYLLHMRKVVRDASRDTLQAYFSWRAISTYQYLVAEEYTRSRVSMFAASETIVSISLAWPSFADIRSSRRLREHKNVHDVPVNI